MTNNMKQALETLTKDLSERRIHMSESEKLKDLLFQGRVTCEDRRLLAACLKFLNVCIDESKDMPEDDDRHVDFKFVPEALMMTIRETLWANVRDIVDDTTGLLNGDESEYDEYDIAIDVKDLLYLLTIIRIISIAFEGREAYQSYCIPAMFAEVTHWEVPEND